MSIQEPAWLKRTRPCPFFSQGRCLFADSCNFLHDVKVRNALAHPPPGTGQAKLSSFLPKSVFDPPSVVVNSASPLFINIASPENLTSPVQDSSRYSGLLSVLSDVIGPPTNPSATPEDAFRATSAMSSSFSSTSFGPTGLSLESDLVAAGFEPVSTIAHMATGQDGSNYPGPFQPDSEATLIDPCLVDPLFPEESVTEFLPVPDDAEPADGDVTSYFVENTETYAIASENDDDEDSNGLEEDFTIMVSNRQSVLSSFTGVSLLASPRNSVFEESSVPSPVEDGVVDLLSPVQLSAKLRPFPIPSTGSKIKRGGSIDSGYADGDSWVGPLPFPCSPPRNFQSSVTFLSHSRRVSQSSPALKEKSVSYGVGALRPSLHHPIEGIEEVESDGCSQHGSEGNEDTAYNILDAYDASPSHQQGENNVHDPLQMNLNIVTEEKDGVSAVICSPQRYSPEHLHPSREYDLDSCNQPSVVSDDNLSFKTALSAPTFSDDLSDKASPVKQDSLLSSISRCSTPDTSVLPYYSDTNEPLEHFIVDSHVYESSFFATGDLASQIDSTGISETSAADQSSLPGEVVIDSDVPSTSASADESQGLEVVGAQELISRVYRRRSSVSSPSADVSHSLSSAKDVLGCATSCAGSDKSCSPVSSPTVLHLHGYLAECAAARSRQSPAEGNTSDEVAECLDSSFNQQLPFPLPLAFSPAEFIGNSTLSHEDASDLSERAIENFGEDLSCACIMPQQEEIRCWTHSGSDLTEKVRSSRLPLVGPVDSEADFTLRRSRAASDLTVKGKSSPVITPVDTAYVSRSPSALPLEQQSRSDSVQSLYDRYFDDGTSDDSSGFSSPVHKNTTPLDMPRTLEEPRQETHPQSPNLIPRVFQRAFSPCSHSNACNSGTDSPPETVLRPLLTGRRSFFDSSLSEIVPKTNFESAKEAPYSHPPTRLQAREIGSTVVPLGFRRHKPQLVAQPLQTILPASQLREVLRIRTDIAREELPPECSSASQVSSTTRSPLPAQSMSAPPTIGLKQLHLSSIINRRSSILSTRSSSIASSILSLDHLFNTSAPQSPSVSSTTSFSRNSSLSSSCEQIPEQVHHHTLKRSISDSPILQATNDVHFAPHPSSTRHDSRSVSPPIQKSWRLSHYRAGSRNYSSVDSTRHFPRRASTLSLSYAVDEEQELDEDDATVSHFIQPNHPGDRTRPTSILPPPVHAIATPKPTLLFAIASDDVDQVRQVLESGEAGPNDSVGPQSALAFTLTNDKLMHKPEIVKALLAYGANPSALRNPASNPAPRIQGVDESSPPPCETTLEGMDPATRYFVARADAVHTRQTSQLIYRSFFRPLTRVRYDVIGQDWALEQLFRVLSMHSQKLAVAPIVVLLCGPSGHGKSLLARRFGFLLDVPTHTVNMTTLRSTHDIWQSFSMSPYEEPSSCTLAEFLIEHEGKRCVVVLDEIEKVEDQKALWSLLMPWELGRCSLEAGKRHVDARNVIWLATSNVGHELVFEYHENRADPDERMSREDYFELTGILRPCVSHCLGASLVSRVTMVLPFVPFTLDEKKAIAAEAVYAFTGETSKMLSPREVESLVMNALPSYQPSEGARSLHRAISNILIDMIQPDDNLAG